MTAACPVELHALRVATPRLELRLGSRDELFELAALAVAGVHLPDEMPFAIAWTDGSSEPGFVERFVEFHEAALHAFGPDDWALNLLVWNAGRLVGTQGLTAKGFPARGLVETGSWLGRGFQGRGLGTEMRAAVLELAFRGLGATEARSTWLEGNAASRRVSEKLAYEVVGEVVREPRPGRQVRAWEVSVRRERWRCPVPVRIEGLAPCRHLFGVPGA